MLVHLGVDWISRELQIGLGLTEFHFPHLMILELEQLGLYLLGICHRGREASPVYCLAGMKHSVLIC
jgi:hypothetical protein